MKTRESGMPEESLWATFFTPEEVLHKLGLPTAGDVVDFGCGYGTFTIPAAIGWHALSSEGRGLAARHALCSAQGVPPKYHRK